MSLDAWNKVTQTHDLFKKIIAPLKEHLGINFGYMIVFNDGRYYQIIEDLECLKKWVTNVETSHIFCARNVTTYFDQPYNFTIWPEEPTCPAMEIYKEYGMWNGITVSKINKDYTELYWFTKENAENGWHKWFIRNKFIIYKLINYFENYKKDSLWITPNTHNNNLFKLQQNFSTSILDSEYIEERYFTTTKLKEVFYTHCSTNSKVQCAFQLSDQEEKILKIISYGYTSKIAAKELNISINTVNSYIERMKNKSGLRYKTELVDLYHNYINNV